MVGVAVAAVALLAVAGCGADGEDGAPSAVLSETGSTGPATGGSGDGGATVSGDGGAAAGDESGASGDGAVDAAEGEGGVTGDDAGGGATTTIRPSVPTLAAGGPDAAEAGGAEADQSAAEPPDERALPTDAVALAAAIDEAESALRVPGIDAATAAPWGRRQQALYRLLSFNDAWATDVLAAVDPAIADAVAANWRAQAELDSLVRTESLGDTLPAWRIASPRPADELLGYYREAGEATGVPWEVLAAINLVETRMGRIDGVSTAGAIGPMQFLPTTWADCCDGDPTDPRDAIDGAARYLVQRGADDDLDRAIWGYNNSDYYVTAVQAYASVMAADPEAYYGYHAWQVYFLSAAGLAVLPVGYDEADPVDAATYLDANPDARFPMSP